MPDVLDKITKELPKLSQAELQVLRSAIGALLSLGGGAVAVKEAKSEDFGTTLLSVYADVMSAKGADFSSVSQLRKAPQYASFREKIGQRGFLLFYQTAVHKNRVAMRALLYVNAVLLYQNLVAMGLPITSRTMMAHTHRLPGVLNASFPGYTQNGLLGMLMKKGDKNARTQ